MYANLGLMRVPKDVILAGHDFGNTSKETANITLRSEVRILNVKMTLKI